MEGKRVNHLEQIPPEDWGKTPTSVKKLVEEMAQQIEQLELKLTEVLTVQEQLLEKINRTSENSSSPPSSDPPGFGKKPPKQKSSKKRGGQPGHKGNSRDLYPIEECSENLLGENFGGILNSDRHGAYNWVDLERRQLCWAHLRREFIKISERTGVSAQLGTALVKQQEKLFELWHRVRDGTLCRDEFVELVGEIRSSIRATLQEANEYEITAREKTPLAKTVRTCRQLLKVESAMWLFVTTVGVEPTNNAAERAIRPAVIWRRTSFGSQTQGGSNFVARMLTVVTTLKSQKRNVLEFMTQTVVAARGDKTAPSLLPETATCSDDSDLLKAA
jgi:Transposase IS66 family/Family of unknown function (DUF6444)